MKLFGRWRKNDDNDIDIPVSKLQANRDSKHSKQATGQKKTSLFDNIVGYEDVKELYEMAIKAEKPVHLLLVGPPASAKSLFMSSLTKLERSYYAVGSSSTKSGICDYLFEYRPRYFIIDEIEKMNKRDQTSLLNLMESGILSELKHNQKRMTQLKTWVFASCNSTDKLLPPLLTRFKDIHFKPYTEQEFVNIVVEILDREEGVDRDVATMIADAVFNRLKSTNIRECIRIARLAGSDRNLAQVDRIIDIFAKYNPHDS
ncbi:AAA family ATPase [Nitrososphaera sp. AFS]|uniref:AAA family ATPase n=1 Tax=Nitrososphaera sp. AFS TaxID=2301191 RepID=UPI001392235C|nr:AAA family ATPase [Nitrososphaera sp. AFS]NAL78269.1 AAA family ATPase [Nitrososphaera sp. AFS]